MKNELKPYSLRLKTEFNKLDELNKGLDANIRTCKKLIELHEQLKENIKHKHYKEFLNEHFAPETAGEYNKHYSTTSNDMKYSKFINECMIINNLTQHFELINTLLSRSAIDQKLLDKYFDLDVMSHHIANYLKDTEQHIKVHHDK